MLKLFDFIIPKAYALTTGVKVGGTNSFTGYCGYLKVFFKYSLGVGFGLVFLMIIYAGIKYIISQGNQTGINDAKEIILGSLLGFIVLLLINLIIKFLGIGGCTV